MDAHVPNTQDQRHPLVSVVIPTYNMSEPLLRKAIDSALEQSHRSMEVIVVDDGSTESLAWLPAHYQDRVIYIRKAKGGCGSARNTGIRRAQGAYIAFLDADDIWAPDKLDVQLLEFERSPAVGLVYARVVKIDAAGAPLPSSTMSEHKPTGKIFEQLFMHNFIPASTVMIRRECLSAVGPFDESEGLSKDYDMWLRIVERFDVGFVDRVLVQYRIHAGGVTYDKNNSYTGELAVIETAIERFKGRYPVVSRWRRKRLHQLFREYGYDLMSLGELKQARCQLWRGLSFSPLSGSTWIYWLATWWPGALGVLRYIKRHRPVFAQRGARS